MEPDQRLNRLYEEHEQLAQRLEQLVEEVAELRQQLAILQNIHMRSTNEGSDPIPPQNTALNSSTAASKRLREFKEQITMLRGRAYITDNNGRQVTYTQRNLAEDIGISETELSGRLNGTSKTRLSCANVRLIIIALIRRKAITSQETVKILLDITKCPGFSAVDLEELDSSDRLSETLVERLGRDLFIKDAAEILSEYDSEILARIIVDKTIDTERRIRALEIYTINQKNDQRLFAALSNDLDLRIRKSIAKLVIANDISVDLETLKRLMADKESEVNSAAVRAARHLVDTGKAPISLLSEARRARYWLSALTAIRYIIEKDFDDGIPVLHALRRTSYHVSKKMMRDYILKRYNEHRLSDKDMEMSMAILEYAMNDKRSTDATRSATKMVINTLRDIKDAESGNGSND